MPLEIAPGVYQLRAFACQVFAVVDRDVTLIDAGAPGGGRLVLRQLRQLGVAPSDVRRIILTHYHIDHRGAVREIQLATGATLLAHTSEAPYLRGELPYPNPVQRGALAGIAGRVLSMARGRPLEVTELQDGEVLDVANGLRVLHSPGHTQGSIALYLQERRLLLAGDTMGFKRRILEAPDPKVSEDVPLARASLERLAGLDVEKIAFAHWEPLLEGGQRQLEQLVATWSSEFRQ
jgi:glyoxylase-like metal-dependent hydrolase (beta-lactamase superfamily II)